MNNQPFGNNLYNQQDDGLQESSDSRVSLPRRFPPRSVNNLPQPAIPPSANRAQIPQTPGNPSLNPVDTPPVYQQQLNQSNQNSFTDSSETSPRESLSPNKSLSPNPPTLAAPPAQGGNRDNLQGIDTDIYGTPTAVYGALPANTSTPPKTATLAQETISIPPQQAGEPPVQEETSTNTRRSPWWLLYGLVVLALIGLVSWQIFRLVTGEVPSAIPLGTQTNPTQTVLAKEPDPIPTAQTEQVKKVLSAQPVTPAQLDGDKHRVTFRSQSGIVVCTIAEKLQDNPPPLIPLAANASGALSSGSGVVCATASNFNAAGNVGKCKQEDLRLSVLGVWDSSSGIGACVNGTTPLYQDVKSGQRDNSGKRFDLQPLGTGQYTQLGKYACTFGGADVTCVNVSTGKGFTFTDLGGYKFF